MATSSKKKDNRSLQGNSLARQLIADGILSQKTLDEYQEANLDEPIPLIRYLVKHNVASSYQIALAVSRDFGMPLLDLDAIDRDSIPLHLIDENLIYRHNALPLYHRGKRLFVGITDPSNIEALNNFKFHAGLNTVPVLVEEDKLTQFMDSMGQSKFDEMMDIADMEGADGVDVVEDFEDDSDVTTISEDDAPVVRFVNGILLDAIRKGASDIHFEPYEKKYRVRFRQDGMLNEVASPPASMAAKIAARIKVMAKLDISERRVPQDGKVRLAISKNKAIDLRTSTCPTIFGEKIVMRILDPASIMLGIEKLGFSEAQRPLFEAAIARPHGMVLVTGPTGSGKTVTLYTALGILNTESRNISTAEDPAEMAIPGANQVNVNPRQGLTFDSALRSFLRQDPDVIMVGEIRDLATAEIAIKAAQTGHMVLSTLHTNDAPQTLDRLAKMGIPTFNIATTVKLIIAQRLARRLCTSCKRPIDIPKEELLKQGFTEADLEQDFTLYEAVGCSKCNEGYKGRVGLYQVMPVSETMSNMIMEGANTLAIANQAKQEGIKDLRESGLEKVMQGITSLEEVNRVTVE
ncbi:MAG: type IV-A pilus assembly ATPase PilB [Gammaproteobacteria bacterium]|nr:MAG: type IV-A pilus assembly ATPase PilB [Gammaproteobacteria bacterium]